MVAASLCPPVARAYEGNIHEQLTFLAARQYNRCAEETHLATLTPLQVRYIAIANANQADAAWWRRMFRWSYYNRNDQSTGKILWMVETRMHNHFGDTLRRLEGARDLSRRFTNLGRVINYLQDATTPVAVVPVYTTRWWRFSVSDRFNEFPVDTDALTVALGEDCTAVRRTDAGFDSLLVDTAERTIASIAEPVPGLPVTWEAFWEFDDDADAFGRYGNAGQQLRSRDEIPLRRVRKTEAQELRACGRRSDLPAVRPGPSPRCGAGDDHRHGDDAGRDRTRTT